MNMTLKEKSTWLSLIATIVVFGMYAFQLLSMDMKGLSESEAIDAAMQYLSSAVLYIVIIEIIFQSLVAAASRSALELDGDERDDWIAKTANTSGYWVLVIGVFITLGQFILPHTVGVESSIKVLLPLPMFEMHLLLFVFILSEIVRFSHQVLLYRKDAV